MGPKYIWVTTLTFLGHVTSSVTWLFESEWAISYWWSIGTKSVSPAVFEVLSHKRIGVATLTFLGLVTSSVTWPFESQWAISYWWSIGTKSVSPAVFEIMGPKYIWVMTLTFLGHVTSSVTWPFESQYVISCWCSIGSKCLSLTDSEILCPKPHVPIGTVLNRHCACAISRDMYPYVKFKYILNIYFNYSPPLSLFTMPLSLGSDEE